MPSRPGLRLTATFRQPQYRYRRTRRAAYPELAKLGRASASVYDIDARSCLVSCAESIGQDPGPVGPNGMFLSRTGHIHLKLFSELPIGVSASQSPVLRCAVRPCSSNDHRSRTESVVLPGITPEEPRENAAGSTGLAGKKWRGESLLLLLWPGQKGCGARPVHALQALPPNP